jgi:hypothetical protein
MTGEGARRRELAELMTHHVLVHLHRQEFVAVVDAKGQPDELRQDGRAARPDPDDLVAARLARGICLVQ